MMHHARRASSFIIQDLAIPRAGAQDFLEWSDRELSLYPLWLCPIAGLVMKARHLVKAGKGRYGHIARHDQLRPSRLPFLLLLEITAPERRR